MKEKKEYAREKIEKSERDTKNTGHGPSTPQLPSGRVRTARSTEGTFQRQKEESRRKKE